MMMLNLALLYLLCLVIALSLNAGASIVSEDHDR